MAEVKKSDLMEEVKTLVSEVMGEEIKVLTEAAEKRNKEDMAKLSALLESKNAPDKEASATKLIESVLAAGVNGSAVRACDYAKKRYESDKSYGNTVKILEASKTIGTTDYSSGGIFVNDDIDPGSIEYLRPVTIFDRMTGTRTIPLKGTYTMPKQTGTGTASYIGEGQTVNESSATFGSIKMEAKKLEAVTAVYEESIEDSIVATSQLAAQDLRELLTVKSDLTLLRGPVTDYAPKGLRYWANSSNVSDITSSTTSTITYVLANVSAMLLALANNNVRPVNPYWIMAPRTAIFLQYLVDGAGGYPFMNSIGINGGVFMGMPVITSTQVPINLTSSTSEIYLVDASQIVLGNGRELNLKMTDVGSYKNSSGSYTSAFADGSVALKATMRHDFALRQDYACAIKTAVNWSL